jgi:magnesium chelatase subunit I
VRALAALLPKMRAVVGCRYACDPADAGVGCADCPTLRGKTPVKSHLIPVPVVDLPLGATEDRVVGALDLERALSQGVKAFEPGLLARANRGFLYIDEVNLLEDHLVDLLIDVAASGENVVEREGLSVRHPARFVLVGSGNPKKASCARSCWTASACRWRSSHPHRPGTRIEVVRRRDAFERDPAAFTAQWQGRRSCASASSRAATGWTRLTSPTPRASGPPAVHGPGHRRPARRPDADARGARAGGPAGRRRRERRPPAPRGRPGAAPPAAAQPAG